MTNDWETVTNLFGAVRLLDETARVAFLDAACAGNQSLRQQIDSLLAAETIDDDFLDPFAPSIATGRDEAYSTLQPGHVLKNRYVVEARHSSGGQSIVYLATDRVLSRRVVIKVMRGAPIHHALLKSRFELEMQALSRIDHPTVVGIHDVGVLDDGAPFLVIQFVDGTTLREMLKERPLATRRVAQIVRQIGAALGAVHAVGVAHQDLKPENVMVQRLADGSEAIKLIDFGIAKITRADVTTHLTMVGIAGSVRYMAPEQFEGRNSATADIYSLGLIACELLSGQPDARTLPRSMHPKARRLIEQAIAYDPEDRPKDVKCWSEDLSRALETRAVPIAPLVTAVAGVLLAVLVYALFTGDSGQADRAGYRFTPLAADAEPKSGAVWSRDGHSIAYNQRVDGIWQLFVRAIDSDSAVQLTHLGTDAKSIFWWPDGSRVGFVSGGHVWTVGVAGRSPETIQRDGFIAADLSADGTTLAVWRIERTNVTTGTLWLASPPTSPARKYVPTFQVSNAFNPVSLRFSPDGRKLLASFYAPDAELWRLPFPDGAGATPRRLFSTTRFAEPATASWMPDSRRAVLATVELSGAQELWMADTESETLARITAGTEQNDDPSVSPDGRRLTFTSYAANMDLVELPLDGGPIRDVLTTSRTECCAAWIPGTTKFAYMTNRNGLPEIRVRDRFDHSDVVVASTRDFRQHAADALLGMGAPSPDGEWIAFLEYSTAGFAIWVTRLSGGTPVRLTHATNPQETAPSWSPDGQWISFLAKIGGARLLMRAHVGTMEPPQVIMTAGTEEATTWCCVPQWSPTGQWIAYVANSGLKLVSPDGTKHRLLSPLSVTALTWSWDGSQIYAISNGSDRRAALSRIDVATGTTKIIHTFEPDIAFESPLNPGVRASLAPDGRSVLSTVLRTRSDIWMLEGFDRHASLVQRLLASLRPPAH